MNSNDTELASLRLLRDTQAELRDALNALGGREGDGLLQHYPFYSAAHINRAVEGYIFLRESGRIDASKLLIRAALETVIRVQAVRKQPDLMFRIAYTESQEDKKWVRPLKRPDFKDALQTIERHWQEFRHDCHAKYPSHPLVEEELSLRRAAELADLDGYYDSHYRLYCRFTHGALGASTGHLNDFEAEDNPTMTLCALAAIDALIALGAPAPNFQELNRRFSSK